MKFSKSSRKLSIILVMAGWIFGALQTSFPQDMSISDTVVNFGTVNAYQTHNAELTIYNNHDDPVSILGVGLDEDEFFTDLIPGEIDANSQHNFTVYFKSNHNLQFTDFLRIELNYGDRPLLVRLNAQAAYEGNYYTLTRNLWDTDLKAALHNIIDDHTELSYSYLWDALSESDEDPDNSDNVILLYTGWSYDKTKNGGLVDEWNHEHVWAKSHGGFDNDPPAGTDMHHIRPTSVTVNSRRGSLDFDNGGTLYVDQNGPTGCYVTSTTWEPRPAVKGDVARMMYYMTVRYEGDEGYDLELVESVPSTTTGQPVFGKGSRLFEWHWKDSVDAWEENRNNIIYNNYQGNRNPFIDHPEFADRLADIHGGSQKTTAPEIAISPIEIDMGKVGLNSQIDYYFVIINSGDAELQVTSISVDNSDFSIEHSSLTIPVEDYRYVKLNYFSGSSEIIESTQITILSNDATEGTIQIPVTVEVSETVSIIHRKVAARTFKLYQNYPNPFNPSTEIKYELPNHSHVCLEIYDILGRLQEVLVDEIKEKGLHRLHWNAANYPAGIYVYILKADGFSDKGKMVLVK